MPVPGLAHEGPALSEVLKRIQTMDSLFLASFYMNKGVALMDMGQPEEALLAFEQALHLKPTYALAHYNKGIALKELGK